MLGILIVFSLLVLAVLVISISNGASFERGPIYLPAETEPSASFAAYFPAGEPLTYITPIFEDEYAEYKYYTGFDHPDLDRSDPLRHFEQARLEGILGLWDRVRLGLPPTREQEFYWNWIVSQQPELVQDPEIIYVENNRWH
jgi:hypothetical protein